MKRLIVFCLLMLSNFIFWLPKMEAVQNTPQEILIALNNNSKNENLFFEIVSEVEKRLASHNILMVKGQPNQSVNITLWQFDYTTIGIAFLKSPLSEISPILDSRGYISMEITLENEDEVVPIAADLATAAALYSFGVCEEIKPYLEKAEDYLIDQTSTYSKISNLSTIYFFRGNCALLEGDFEGALPLLEKGLQYDDFGVLIGVGSASNLAWAYLQIGREIDAVTLMKRLVEDTKSRGDGLAQTYIEALIARAKIYALMSQYDEAIADISEAIEWMPANSFYELRGQMYINIYEWDYALADFNTIIEHYPNNAPAYFQRGVLYYSILQTGVSTRDEALADFERYLALAPEGEYAEQAAAYIAQIEAAIEALEE